jgi:CheY-like chemotaxis protein
MNATLQLLLADDDMDDCFLFREILEELSVNVTLTTVDDGVKLMQYLNEKGSIPDALYLDLNIPRKNGFDCLAEIRMDAKLKSLPVIIYSTSYDKNVVNNLKESGASFYVRKPSDFQDLKNVILKSINILRGFETEDKDNFVITAMKQKSV